MMRFYFIYENSILYISILHNRNLQKTGNRGNEEGQRPRDQRGRTFLLSTRLSTFRHFLHNNFYHNNTPTPSTDTPDRLL